MVVWYALSALSVVVSILSVTGRVLDGQLDASVQRELEGEIMRLEAAIATDDGLADMDLLGVVTAAAPRDGVSVAVVRDGTADVVDPLGSGELLVEALGVLASTGAENTLRSGQLVTTRVDEDTYAHLAVTLDEGSASDGGAGAAQLIVGVDVTDDKAENRYVVGVLAIVAAVVTCVVGLVAWLALGIALRPLRDIRDAALAIDETDLSTRIRVDASDDEVGQLGLAINRMLGRIEEAYSRRIDFEDRLGHEIRTPLAIIRGQLEVFPQDEDGQARAIEICRDELSMIDRDVESLVMLSESRNPSLLAIRPVDLSDLTDQAARRARLLNPANEIDVRLADAITLLCDPDRILQALSNLIDNACNYSPPGSTVRLSSVVEGEGGSGIPIVRFEVSDDGPGLTDAEVANVFTPFQRGRTSRTRGLGLGLNVVQIIAEAHGGEVGVISSPGHGATFWFTIDAAPEPDLDLDLDLDDLQGGRQPLASTPGGDP